MNPSQLEQKVKQTLSQAKVPKNARILVAMSGGKDSATVVYLLHKLGYKNLEGLYINLEMAKYSDDCLKAVQDLCKQLNIKLHLYGMKQEMGSSMCYIRQNIQAKSETKLKNCAICGVVKKWILNKKARELNSHYIATGHNLDDEAQTFLMNIFKGSPKLSANSGAITKNISNKKFISRIKPLFYIPEDEVRAYAVKMKIPHISQKCPCATDSYRLQLRAFLNTLTNKQKENIIKNFEKLQPLIEKGKDTRFNYCESCGEPSRNVLCKKCELMKK